VLYVFAVEAVVPVARAVNDVRQRRKHDRAHSSSRTGNANGGAAPLRKSDMLAVLASSPAVAHRFQAYCQNYFCVESARFVTDVLAFKEFALTHRAETTAAKARAIFKLYIDDAALLRVNLPSHVYASIAAQIGTATNNVPPQLFDEALQEIAALLKWPLWFGFVAQGGLDEYHHKANVHSGMRSRTRGGLKTTPTASATNSPVASPAASPATSPRASRELLPAAFAL